MSDPIDFFDIVVMIGIIQGLLSAIAIEYSSSGTVSKKLLAAILVTLSLLGFKILLHTLGLWQNENWRYFPLAIDTLIQPLFYLYTCSLTTKSFRFTRKQLFHFVPTMLFELHAIIVYLTVLTKPDHYTKDIFAEQYFFYNSVKWTEDLASLILAGVYWYLSYKKTQSYRQWLFSSQSATHYPELRWLKNLLIGTGILVAILLLSSIPANILHFKNTFPYTKLFYIYLTLLIYFLSFQGYRAMLLSETHIARPSKTTFAEAIKPSLFPEKSTVHEEDYSIIQTALEEAMRKQLLYIDPELSLKDLSRIIGFPAAQVSTAINSGFEQNFRSWVNRYRVEEVKKRLNDPAHQHLSLTGIAFECGFNSEPSFYRIFRQHTGHSPKTYQQQLKRKS